MTSRKEISLKRALDLMRKPGTRLVRTFTQTSPDGFAHCRTTTIRRSTAGSNKRASDVGVSLGIGEVNTSSRVDRAAEESIGDCSTQGLEYTDLSWAGTWGVLYGSRIKLSFSGRP